MQVYKQKAERDTYRENQKPLVCSSQRVILDFLLLKVGLYNVGDSYYPGCKNNKLFELNGF